MKATAAFVLTQTETGAANKETEQCIQKLTSL